MLGYRLLAEAFISEKRLDDALKAIEKLPPSIEKETLAREVRNAAVRTGRFDLFVRTSEIAGLNTTDTGDLAAMLFANVRRNKVGSAIEILEKIQEGKTKDNLTLATVLLLANQGSIISCERIAAECNIQVTRDQAMIARTNAIREGWISDAERAAEICGLPLTKEDYHVMLISNKDKGLLFDAQESAKRAEMELDEMSLIALLLAGVKRNTESVWEIAEMLSRYR